MKLVDEIYQMYEHHFTGDEEDAWLVVAGIIEEFDRDDFMNQIDALSDTHLTEMFALYVYEKLREKMAREGLGYTRNVDDGDGNLFH
ncbi:DUF6154 family protein [Bacillus sp. FJAT-45350]|uniref:DUF6154 family protein n=1 Tax=Bacillus sp. FJAT-45350 TaxID=2011014 RepID=UPI000BB93A37|nr:DUF6154 family protein [Bacillus sp. FJAT-45350]